MGFSLTHVSSATTIELSKEPDLPLGIDDDGSQDVIETDSGKRKIFSRKIRIEKFSIILKLLNHYDRRLLHQFIRDTLNFRDELFDMEIQIDHEEPLQVGALQDGVAITVGTVLDPDCGNPGGAILVGDWVRQDRYIFANCRLDQGNIYFSDEGPRNFSTELRIVQELT